VLNFVFSGLQEDEILTTFGWLRLEANFEINIGEVSVDARLFGAA
jgi:hypothetical protein